MEATEVKTQEDVLLCIYQGVKMGADAIVNLLPKVKDSRLKSDMTVQLAGYEALAAKAKQSLRDLDVQAEEKGMMTKAMAKMGTMFNTMIDSTLPHIAQMMIEGSNMGIVEMDKCINACSREDMDGDAVKLAREVVAFEEENLERMKKYL